MDCNKDEALRAKKIAEEKFTTKDIVGAKKFALKAQNLFPGLEGISQMLATLDIYVSAENKINGEADWYGILGVDSRADEETVRKHYRKLALILHPDKNKSIGADGAFKLISQAWSLLSDKSTRVIYDQKRNGRANKNIFSSKGSSSSQSGRNGFHNFTKRDSTTTTSNVRGQKSATRSGHSSTPPLKPKSNTFWTVCHRCKMQYEYLRVYLNHNLLCPNCHEPFFAIETPPPPSNGVKSKGWDFTRPNHQAGSKSVYGQGRSTTASSHMGAGQSNRSSTQNQSNFQWGPFQRTGGASSAAQAATVVQQAYEKVKRQREEAQAAKREERRKNQASKKANGSGYSGAVKRRRGIDDISSSSHARERTNQSKTGANLFGCTQAKAETSYVNGDTSRDVYLNEIQNLLMEKAKKEIRKVLHECDLTALATVAVKEGHGNEKVTEKRERTSVSVKELDKDILIELQDTKSEAQSRNAFPSSSNREAENRATLSIDVPDPDFYDFDRDRSESSFGEKQVWAAYNDDDGMPRYYAWIHSVVSLNPFKMRISWLNSKTNCELGPLCWVSSGFSKTCGDFRTGRYEIYSSLNSFSHKVRWSKGTSGVIRIYPRTGDVWALYRNWSSGWNELTSYEVVHKYDMVEVLEDYNEELGVTIIPLVKVAGFKSVFHQHLDPKQIKKIPKDEIFRFSHLVPSHLLTGQEAPNAPKGCRELDPAAIPVDLLHVVETAKEEESMEINDLELENAANKMEDVNDENMEEKSGEAMEENISKPMAVEVVKDGLELKLVKKMERIDEMEVS